MSGRPSSAQSQRDESAFAESVSPERRTSPALRRSVSQASSTALAGGRPAREARKPEEESCGKLCDAFDQASGRIAGFERDADDLAPKGFEFARFKKSVLVRTCTAALYGDIGQEPSKKFARRWIVKFDDIIDGGKSSKDLHALSSRSDRAGRCLAQTLAGLTWAAFGTAGRPDACVTFNRDDENITERAGLFEEPNVAGMEQVETAARAHYSLTAAFPLAPVKNQLTLRNDLSQTPVPRSAPKATAEEAILARAVATPPVTRQGGKK